jgi:hypothetical protein
MKSLYPSHRFAFWSDPRALKGWKAPEKFCKTQDFWRHEVGFFAISVRFLFMIAIV